MSIKKVEDLVLGFRRVIANIFDIFLVYTLCFLILSQDDIFKNFERYNIISPDASLSIKHLLLTAIVFFFYRFYSSLLFSVSIGQWLFGLKLEGATFLQKRLSSCLRFVFFPLVLIINFIDRFLKNEDKRIERYVFGNIQSVKSGVVRDFFAGFFLVVVSLAFAFSPFLYHGPLHFNPKISIFLKEDKKIDKEKNFNLYQSFGSKSLEFYTFSDLEAARFKLNPSYELKRNNGKLIYRPIVSLWDNGLGVKGLFKINKRFDFYQLLLEMRSNYPFFSSEYPNLSATLDTFDSEKNAQMPLSDEGKRELFELISNSLITTPTNILSLYSRGKFYFFPYLIFKERLFSLMGKESDQSIDFVQKGEDLFLRTIYKDEFNDNYRERFFTYNNLRPVIYEVIWQKGPNEEEVNDLFNKTFFGKAVFGVEVISEALSWEKDNIFNPISIVDFIGHTKFNEDGIKKFEKYLYTYFFNQAKEGLNLSVEYQNLLLASMQRLFVVWQLKIKNDKIPFSKLTIKKFSDMMKSFELRDADFFRTNSDN